MRRLPFLASFVAVAALGVGLVVYARGDDTTPTDLSEFSGQGNPAAWRLAPGSELGPETVEFDVLLTEMSCTGGLDADGRVPPPVVRYRSTEVDIQFTVIPLPGFADCIGSPETLFTVTLDEPLGERELIDSSGFGQFFGEDFGFGPQPFRGDIFIE